MLARYLLVLVLCAFLTSTSTSALHAQILLKPRGSAALPLRVKAVEARAVIEKQVAQTTLNLTFLNETPSQVEADFFYTVSPGTVVSHFAYWFGEEKVVARIVE